MALKIDQNDPLFIGSLDVTSAVLIPIKLTGRENYDVCREDLHEQWETSNAIVLS